MRAIPSRYTKFELTGEEEKYSRQVNACFWAYLQNKIADYADAILETKVEFKEGALTDSILELERMKARVEMLEELMRELDPPVEFTTETPASQSQT